MPQNLNPLASITRARQQAWRAGEVVRVFARYGFGNYVKPDTPAYPAPLVYRTGRAAAGRVLDRRAVAHGVD